MELLPNKIIQKDVWTTISAEDTIPIHLENPTIMPFGEPFVACFAQTPHHHNLGCLITNDQDVLLLADYINKLPLIALVFPVFNDGRAFSQARTLRSTLGFKGILRATGNVLPPQIGFMRRCGFDSIIVDTDRFPEDVWLDSVCQFPAVYQKQDVSHTQGDDTPVSILQRRKTTL